MDRDTEEHRSFGAHDGDPATWIAGVSGLIFLEGEWQPFDSVELAHDAKVMTFADFTFQFPDAAQALKPILSAMAA
jgi:hypothetical protein